MAKAIVHISAKEEAKQQKGEKKKLFMDKNFHIMIIVICNVIYIYIYIYMYVYILVSNCQ